MGVKINKPMLPLDLNETPRQILENDFPSIGNLPISGGWGYSKDACIIIDRDDPTVSKEMPFDGISVEYIFIEKRIYKELIVFRPKGYQFSGIEWNLNEQRLESVKNRYLDFLSFKVTAFPDDDWDYLKKAWETNNGFIDSLTDLTLHQKEREKRICYYNTEYWFDITSFFGKA